jgi:hypothetical protein
MVAYAPLELARLPLGSAASLVEEPKGRKKLFYEHGFFGFNGWGSSQNLEV